MIEYLTFWEKITTLWRILLDKKFYLKKYEKLKKKPMFFFYPLIDELGSMKTP